MSLTQDETERLLQEALKARDGSYCVYSNFRVGACLLTADGHYVRGANVEACNYAGTICAERTAIVKAVSDGQRTFKALAVASDLREPISPCGFCRQLLREFCRLDMPIFLMPCSYEPGKTEHISLGDLRALSADDGSRNDKLVATTMDDILPFSFGPADLAKPRPAATT